MATVCTSQLGTRPTLLRAMSCCGAPLLKVGPLKLSALQLNSFQETWGECVFAPIAVFYTQDACLCSGWLWRLDVMCTPPITTRRSTTLWNALYPPAPLTLGAPVAAFRASTSQTATTWRC